MVLVVAVDWSVVSGACFPWQKIEHFPADVIVVLFSALLYPSWTSQEQRESSSADHWVPKGESFVWSVRKIGIFWSECRRTVTANRWLVHRRTHYSSAKIPLLSIPNHPPSLFLSDTCSIFSSLPFFLQFAAKSHSTQSCNTSPIDLSNCVTQK